MDATNKPMDIKQPEGCPPGCTENHEHAWKGAWERPMKIDENSLDPLTVARMTDHNVRGTDENEDTEGLPPDSTEHFRRDKAA
jgi:hypothetical protein